MNLNNWFLKSFRILLLPFSIIYGLVIRLRNLLYDKKIFRSAVFNFPLICVGNLSVGGTGKSPMVEYLIELLSQEFKVATLSRGYKRKTKGYALAKADTTALEIGDEPMQFHLKYPEIPVAVGEERIVAIPQLLHDRPETEVIILDDAFQHREITAGLNVLLTQYNDLYSRDFFLPTGNLRDERTSAKRAQIIVVTKCPPDLSETKKKEIIKELNPDKDQQIFFTAIAYGLPYQITDHTEKPLSKEEEVLLVCGIANPQPLKEYIASQVHTYYELSYSDHHIFTIDDLRDMEKKFESIMHSKKRLITTEKDAVRLHKFTELKDVPMYVLPVKHHFLFGMENAFHAVIKNFILNFKDGSENPVQ